MQHVRARIWVRNSMHLTVYDLIGLCGTLTLLITYALLQAGRLQSAHWRYSALNAAGAGLILISLVADFNLAAFTIEAAWLVLSLYGLVKSLGGK